MSVCHLSRRAALVLTILTLATGCVAAADLPDVAAAKAIEAQLAKSSPTPTSLGATPSSEPSGAIDLAALYRSRKFQPAWLAKGQPTARATALRARLDTSADEGLPPQRYRVADIARRWRKPDAASRAKLDIALTEALVRYVQDLTEGRADLRALESPASDAPPRNRPALKSGVQKALDTTDLDGFLRQLPPQDPEYQQLKAALHNYRLIARHGGWKSVPAGPVLKPGMSDPRIPALRQRLAMTADFAGGNLKSSAHDAEFGTAVRHFQVRHALPSEGIIGAATIAAMNVPVEQRIRQILINMERHRWSARRIAGRHIQVNIPGFDLVARRDAQAELTMPVVVGKAYQQTPVFDERLEYIEVNPDWLVPATIAIGEYLPELRQDPTSLSSKHIRIFEGLGKNAPEVDPRAIDWNAVTEAKMIRYAFRQDPGPWNALGTLKFMFPNWYNVYFHDTSEPRFFSERQRTFSHGCIRVSRPYELAAWVLAEEPPPAWDIDRIRAAVASGQHQTIGLRKPIPVQILYRTVLIGPDLSPHFLTDIYGRDALLAQSLSGDEETAVAMTPSPPATNSLPPPNQDRGTPMWMPAAKTASARESSRTRLAHHDRGQQP